MWGRGRRGISCNGMAAHIAQLACVCMCVLSHHAHGGSVTLDNTTTHHTLEPLLRLNVSRPAWHTAAVTCPVPPPCTPFTPPPPPVVVPWYLPEASPGRVTFVAHPPPVSASAYAPFTLNTTGPGLRQGGSLVCSLDGGAWAGCGPSPVFGPLAAGSHQVQARGVVGTVLGAVATHTWMVAPVVNVTLSTSASDTEPFSRDPYSHTR
jgi:hypothetical protein